MNESTEESLDWITHHLAKYRGPLGGTASHEMKALDQLRREHKELTAEVKRLNNQACENTMQALSDQGQHFETIAELTRLRALIQHAMTEVPMLKDVMPELAAEGRKA